MSLLVLALAACDTAASVGNNRPETGLGATGAAGAASTRVAATGDRVVAPLDADATASKVGIGFLHDATADGPSASFVMTDRNGNAVSEVVALGTKASAAAGIGIAADPAAKRFYAAWVEESAAHRIHIHVLEEGGTVIDLAPVTPGKAGTIHGLDVFASGAEVLVSGFVGTSELFLASVSAKSGLLLSFELRKLSDLEAPRTSLQGARGDCREGAGCIVTVRDAQGVHPHLGSSDAPAIGVHVIPFSRTVVNTEGQGPYEEVSYSSYQFGNYLSADEGGTFPRVTREGKVLVSVGALESGEARLQGVGQSCGAVTLRGCEYPSEQRWRADVALPPTLNAIDAVPVAISTDDDHTVIAMTRGRAGDPLVFDRRVAPWPNARGNVRQSALPTTTVHVLAADLTSDPVLVKLKDGWEAVWIEGSHVFARAL